MSDATTKAAVAKATTPTGTPGATGLSTIDNVPLPVPRGGGKVDFLTEPNSPWPDGYSLAREREALADIADAPDADKDPRWDRLIELEKREAQYIGRQNAYRARSGAEPVVEYAVATSRQHLGSLVNEAPDTMTVHTQEAFRMFIGRLPNAEMGMAAIPGGKRQGAALRNLWQLTANNNPYAEWALLLHERLNAEVRVRMAKEISVCAEVMAKQAARGLKMGLLRSSKPQDLELGFRSPYAYDIVELILEYDRFVLHIKTLQNKGQLSDEVVRSTIADVTRQIRYAWEQVVRFERLLSRDELKALSRNDFLPSANGFANEGAKRALAASQMFRGIPDAVFEGRQQPKHSKRRATFSAADRALLRSAHQALAAQADVADKAAAHVDAADGDAAATADTTE